MLSISALKDHPRTRGEKTLGVGSFSPSPRITPAHAGKSNILGNLAGQGADHPRTRGEKPSIVTPLDISAGSPPHTRGKAGVKDIAGEVGRITPAHAGKRLKNPVKSPFIMLF